MSKATQLRQKAQNFLKKGKIDKAIEEYKKLLTAESRNPNLYNELGDIYLKAGDKVQAVSAFEKASMNYEKVALYNNAVAVCKKILRIIPKRLDTVFKLGEIKAKQKFMGEAENYFAQYFDSVMAQEGAENGGVQEKTESALELVPDSEAVWSKASDVFSHIGLKSKAAEILAELITRNGMTGDPQRINFYRSRLDLLKQSLKREELDAVEKIISKQKPDVEEKVETVATGLNSEGIKLEDYGAALSEEHAVAQEEAGGEDKVAGSAGGEKAAAAESADKVAEPVSSMPGEADISGSAGISGEDADILQDVDEADPVVDDTKEKEYVIETQTAEEADDTDDAEACEDEPATEISEDLSSLIEQEDEQIEKESSIKNLAEEITSDVEEDDFKSHYDLGMAYTEMGLYPDAIRELQISARSEQLQLQSLEMIGHCFILLNNPRLAVKQLQRGLEISSSSGQESLGIHYNLGCAYEALNEMEKAREHFEEVYIVDVTFRDITDKMKKFSIVS